MTASELLRQREYRGIRVALIARLIILLAAIPLDQTLTAASQTGRINSLIALGTGLVCVGLLLVVLQRTRHYTTVGLAAVAVDVALMISLLVGWRDAIGGSAVPAALLFKTTMCSVMAVFVALNALTLRPLYPLLATVGMVAIYAGVGAIAIGDPRSQWTSDYLISFVGPPVSVPQMAGELALLLFVGALVVAVTAAARRLVLEGIRLERANGQLGRYFSPAVRDRIAAADEDFLKPGGREQNVAVLFSDIRDFTRLADSLPPDELMALVSDYQSCMVAAVFAHGGTLDKFIGDAVMATFGTPVPHPEAARQAVDAAIAMRTALTALNRERSAAGKREIRHGIGIHYGPAIVGNVGTAERLEYTVMGDTVNIAARVTDHCKIANEDLLISDGVRAHLGGAYALRALPAIEARGRREPVPVFAIGAGAGDVTAANAAPDFGREG